MPKKGTVVLVPFPFTNLSGVKVRPAVVVSLHSRGTDTVVAFITSRKGTRGAAGSFRVRVGDEGFARTGLKTDSFILCTKLATLDKRVLLGELGALAAPMRKALDQCLAYVFGLSA